MEKIPGSEHKVTFHRRLRIGGVKDFAIMVIFIVLLFGYLIMAGIIKKSNTSITGFSYENKY